MPKYKVHPIAAIFPMMSEAELQDMANNIKENGQIYPIQIGKWLEDGEEVEGIIDGRNRNRACEILGKEPRTEQFTGKDPTAYIISANMMRRDLNKGQKAMAVAMIYPDAKDSGTWGGARDKSSSRLRGAILNNSDITRSLVSRARKVLRHSTPLAQEVMDGIVLLDRAIDKVDIEALQREKDVKDGKFLEENYPELHDAYMDNRISLEEAKKEVERRIKLAKEEEAKLKAEEDHKQAMEEARIQGLKDQYERGFEGLKKSLESAGNLSDGIYRDIPEWLDDNQTTYDPDTAYEAFNKFFPRGYTEFQAMVNLLEATTRGISQIRQALATYERNRRPAPTEVQSVKPRSLD